MSKKVVVTFRVPEKLKADIDLLSIRKSNQATRGAGMPITITPSELFLAAMQRFLEDEKITEANNG